MFKKLDILIVRSFVGPFIVTFFVSLFVLVMQFFWLYMDELLGKGFGVWMILQLLFFMSSTMVPLALPLGILLASIMTFGSMGESYELVAIKSSGISLLRVMKPLLVVISLVGVGAFFFNNNVIPRANLRAFSLLYDLRNAKMSFNIRPGVFNSEVPGFTIKVGSKDKEGSTVRNVIIYERGPYGGNTRVVLAESGEMSPSPDGKFLVFRLRNGWRYQEGGDASAPNSGPHATQTRMHFVRYDKIIDLSALKLSRSNEDLFKGGYQMMNVHQLREDMAQIRKTKRHDIELSEANFAPYLPVYSKTDVGKDFRRRLDSLKRPPEALATGFAARIPDSLRNKVVDAAVANVRNAMQLVGYTANNVKINDDNLVKRQIVLHSKYTLSFACVLLFLIGAPLGAIIRKGGLGLPIIVAIGFFVLYFIMSKAGEEIAKAGTVPAWVGMWLSTAMLLPIAIFIVRAAQNDSPLFSKESYARLWRRLMRLFRKPVTEQAA